MKYAKKMKLIEINEPYINETSMISLQKPNDENYLKPKVLYDLDNTMRNILEQKNISDNEKWGLYSQALSKYLNYSKFNKNPSSTNETDTSFTSPSPSPSLNMGNTSSSVGFCTTRDDNACFHSFSSMNRNSTMVGDSSMHYASEEEGRRQSPQNIPAQPTKNLVTIHQVGDILQKSQEIAKTRQKSKEDDLRHQNNAKNKCYVALDSWYKTTDLH